MAHEARAHEEEKGRQREQKERDAPRRLVVGAPTEAVEERGRREAQGDRHQPRGTGQDADREKRRMAGGILGIPASVRHDHVLGDEELRRGGRRSGDLTGREDLRLEELYDAVHQLGTMFERERRYGDEDSCECDQEQEHGPGSTSGEPRSEALEGGKRALRERPGQEPRDGSEDRHAERPLDRADVRAIGAKFPRHRSQGQERDSNQEDPRAERQEPRRLQSRRSSGSGLASANPTRSATT